MAAGLDAVRTAVEQVLPRLTDHPGTNGAPMNGVLTPPRPVVTAAPDALVADVKARLAEWHAASGASQDCPLSDLYRTLDGKLTPLGVHAFFWETDDGMTMFPLQYCETGPMADGLTHDQFAAELANCAPNPQLREGLASEAQPSMIDGAMCSAR